MKPAGTSADLVDIATWIDPDATAEQVSELAGHLLGVAIYLLAELAASADGRTTRDEIDRYDRIARAAADLRAALGGQSSPGRLLGLIAQSISQVDAVDVNRQRSKTEPMTAGREDADPQPSNLDAVRAICWPGWVDEAHPLTVIERLAKKVAADLAVVGGRGGGKLHARTRNPPETAFGVACGRLLATQLREPPSISEIGKLHDLMMRVWKYATGDEPPAGLGHHAKQAARRIRREPLE